jgi:hypothetical protein
MDVYFSHHIQTLSTLNFIHDYLITYQMQQVQVDEYKSDRHVCIFRFPKIL